MDKIQIFCDLFNLNPRIKCHYKKSFTELDGFTDEEMSKYISNTKRTNTIYYIYKLLHELQVHKLKSQIDDINIELLKLELKERPNNVNDEINELKKQIIQLQIDNKKLTIQNCQFSNDKLHNSSVVSNVKTDYETRYKNKIRNLERDIEYMTNNCSRDLIYKYKKLLEDNNIDYNIESDSDGESSD